jgi:hypothetical protein
MVLPYHFPQISQFFCRLCQILIVDCFLGDYVMARFWFTSAPLPAHIGWGGLREGLSAPPGGMMSWGLRPPIKIDQTPGCLGDPKRLALVRRPCPKISRMRRSARYRRASMHGSAGRSSRQSKRCAIGGPDQPAVIVAVLSAAALAGIISVPLAVGDGPQAALDGDQLLYIQRELGQGGTGSSG